MESVFVADAAHRIGHEAALSVADEFDDRRSHIATPLRDPTVALLLPKGSGDGIDRSVRHLQLQEIRAASGHARATEREAPGAKVARAGLDAAVGKITKLQTGRRIMEVAPSGRGRRTQFDQPGALVARTCSFSESRSVIPRRWLTDMPGRRFRLR